MPGRVNLTLMEQKLPVQDDPFPCCCVVFVFVEFFKSVLKSVYWINASQSSAKTPPPRSSSAPSHTGALQRPNPIHLILCQAEHWIRFYHLSICVGERVQAISTIAMLLNASSTLCNFPILTALSHVHNQDFLPMFSSGCFCSYLQFPTANVGFDVDLPKWTLLWAIIKMCRQRSPSN